jgi:hypothetical protein
MIVQLTALEDRDSVFLQSKAGMLTTLHKKYDFFKFRSPPL